jgi:hypothetical protein
MIENTSYLLRLKKKSHPILRNTPRWTVDPKRMTDGNARECSLRLPLDLYKREISTKTRWVVEPARGNGGQ